MTIPQWLAAIIAATLLTAMLGIVKLVSSNSGTNDLQDQRLGRIEQTQEAARGVIEREDARDRDLHAELAKLRERLARLERLP